MDLKVSIAIISTFFVVIPLIASMTVSIKAGKIVRLFCFYLLLGFVTDSLAWVLFIIEKPSPWFSSFVFKIYDLYSPLEALFFFWFTGYVSQEVFNTNNSSKYFLIFTIPVWLLMYYGADYLYPDFTFHLFDALYAIIVVFLASRLLLVMTEKDPELLSQPIFWLLMGIFFYNFSSFFIMLLKQTDLGRELWFLHNLINIFTYMIYTVGFSLQWRKPICS